MTPNVCTLLLAAASLTSREFCSHHRRQPDSTKQFCRVGVGGVKWVLFCRYRRKSTPSSKLKCVDALLNWAKTEYQTKCVCRHLHEDGLGAKATWEGFILWMRRLKVGHKFSALTAGVT